MDEGGGGYPIAPWRQGKGWEKGHAQFEKGVGRFGVLVEGSRHQPHHAPEPNLDEKRVEEELSGGPRLGMA